MRGGKADASRLVGEAVMAYETFLQIFFFFKVLFIYFQRGEGRERNSNVWLPLMRLLLGTWPATQACALTGN